MSKLGVATLCALVACGPTNARTVERSEPTPERALGSSSEPLQRQCKDGSDWDENRPRDEVAPPSPSSCPAGMARLPAGRFTLGQRPDAGEVDVAAFCLDLDEVTVAAYTRCVDDRKCSDKGARTRFWNGQDQGPAACNYGESERTQHPMNCVDWTMADTFCRAQGKRLPSEIEWEWAARGGDEARRYPWGEQEPGERGCWLGQSEAPRRSTCEVGRFAAGNARFGHRDLAGNVWEWTSTRLDAPCSERIIRGGKEHRGASSGLTAAARGYDVPSFRSGALGFRCAQ